MQATNYDLPIRIENLSREQCAIMLQKALAVSTKFASIAQLARSAGLNRRTINSYFLGRKKPRIENWARLREVLIEAPPKQILETPVHENELKKAVHSAEKIKALKLLLLDELEYFRDATISERQILKKVIPGAEAGYLSSLLAALYDEDQLTAWITFSGNNRGGRNGNS